MSDNLDMTPQLTLTPGGGHRCGRGTGRPGGPHLDPRACSGGPG